IRCTGGRNPGATFPRRIPMAKAYIISAVRTAIGRAYRGRLEDTRTDELGEDLRPEGGSARLGPGDDDQPVLLLGPAVDRPGGGADHGRRGRHHRGRGGRGGAAGPPGGEQAGVPPR